MNLDEIEARANAATPGPWDVERETGLISTDDGCAVASIHPHGNVRTVIHTGERYSHSDAAFIAAARSDVPALIARVRELEAELDELWTRYKKLDEEDDNLREALAGAYSGYESRCRCATYSEGETLLRAQAAEAQQLAKQMMGARDALSVVLKRAHGALADAGDVPVPELHEHIDGTIRAIVRQRDEERMRSRVLEQTLAETQADLERSLACWEEAGMQGRSAHSVMLGLAEERDRYKGAYDSIRARIDAIELDMARKPA